MTISHHEAHRGRHLKSPASLSGVWGKVSQTLPRFHRLICIFVSPAFYQRWLQISSAGPLLPTELVLKWPAVKSEPFTYTLQRFPQSICNFKNPLARVLEVCCQCRGVERCLKCPRVGTGVSASCCHLCTQTSAETSIISFGLWLQDKWLESTMDWVACCTETFLCRVWNCDPLWIDCSLPLETL